MEDAQVGAAFLGGAAEAAGPTLHIERDALLLEGWWHAAIRLRSDVFALRIDTPPSASPCLDRLADDLTARGLRVVVAGHPLMQPLTYAELDLVGAEWALWATDPDTAEVALAARLGAESAPRDFDEVELYVHTDTDVSYNFERSRRVAGIVPSVVLVVGLDFDQVHELAAALPECQLVSRSLGDIAPDGCGELRPGLVVVDARRPEGAVFAMQLRAAACGRFLPVAALAHGKEPPWGADIVLDPACPPALWRSDLRNLLP